MKKFLSILSILLIFSINQIFAVTILDESVNGVDRYAIYIGANDGGKGRERLLYAGSDALSFKNAMAEIGGVTDTNSRVLIDPTKETIDSALKEISDSINSKSGQTKRSEFIFYYSGHSDENALLLGNSRYDYSKLKAAISDVPSDIHVVILDSCYSGNFIRTKGGQKRKPFLIDDSSVVTGHAYLSSSSDNESSQESDEIESSYFTNAMITGLRGAADTSGDNKVTLNELYSYAFSDTLSKTETSKAGPQHPNYNITLVGSGDLILSDLTIADSMLSLSKDAKGRFIIRDSNDKLISEINKTAGQPIFIALPVGQYSALIIDEYSTKQGTFILEKDQVYVLDQNSLGAIKRKSNRLRGDENTETKETFFDDNDEDTLGIEELTETKKHKTNQKTSIEKIDLVEEDEELNESFKNTKTDIDFDDIFVSWRGIEVFPVPGVSIINAFGPEDLSIAIGIVGSTPKNVYGLNFSMFMNIASGSIAGLQYADLFNITKGDISGAQVSGGFNISKNIRGAQVGGIFNLAEDVNGAQIAGILNLGHDINGSQISGILNVSNDIDGSQIAAIGNIAHNNTGSQISSIFNFASKINGSQIGLINIAKENNGVTLGLINIIGNGLCDISTSLNTNDMIDFYFQEGAKHLYTIFGGMRDFKNVDNDYNKGVFYTGLGTHVDFSWHSFEFEFLWKLYWLNIYDDENKELSEKLDKKSSYEKFQEMSVPCFRVNWNFLQTSHAAVFVSTSFDFFYPEYNNFAREMFSTKWAFDTENATISPSIAIGGKLHL